MTSTVSTNPVVLAVTPFMEKMMEQHPHFTDQTPIDEMAQALTTLAPVSELNTIVRMIHPDFKLTGKGITTVSKAMIIMDYVFDQYEEEEEARLTKEEMDELAAAEDMKKEEEQYEKEKEEMRKAAEQQQRIEKTVAFINAKMGMEVVSIHTPVDVLRNMAQAIKAKEQQPTFTQDQLDQAVQSGFQAGVEEAVSKVEEAPKKTVDVVGVYDALQAQFEDLTAKAREALKAGNKVLFKTLNEQKELVSKKLEELEDKHESSIFSPERAKALVSSARQSVADSLRTGAEVTDKYGHMGVDGLVDLANQILDGLVLVAKTTIDITGKVGHVGVDAVSGTLNVAADLVEPKKN